MTTRVEVSSQVLSWARERSRRDDDYLTKRFPKLREWESGEALPTLNQLEEFAKATYTPIGYFFLQEPPVDRLPIPDFRTVRNASVSTPSPNLLDTVAVCRQRQDWYRSYLEDDGAAPVPFVGSLRPMGDIVTTASAIRVALSVEDQLFADVPSWSAARGSLADRCERAGVLVMINGIVDSNTHRKLDPDEFRGFALADELAPIIFVNGADAMAAQIFTLAHELVHIGINQSAVSNPSLGRRQQNEIEIWCNKVAGEFLVPMGSFRLEFNRKASLESELTRLARKHKVSTLVILRRVFDAEILTWEQYREAFDKQVALATRRTASGDGDFNVTQPIRTSKRFARAIIASTLEGRTRYTEAFRLLGFHKTSILRGQAVQQRSCSGRAAGG